MLGPAATATGASRALPPIVFVSRVAPTGAATGQVPGLGPGGTFAGSGGRLLERSPDGSVRSLVAAGRLFDVADPDVSADGALVAFSARERSGAPWRVWTVERQLGGLRCVTCDDTLVLGDDADPSWWGDTLLYVSTRGGGRALYDGTPVTQMWARFPDGRRRQLTHEANGVLDPVADRDRRRVLYSRWWFNPWRADATGALARGSAAAESVNAWQVVSARLVRGVDGLLRLDGVRLAAGGTLPRRRGMGVQPAPLANGGLLAVAARNTGLSPRPGTLALQRFGAPPSPGRRLAGAAIGDDAGDPYTENANLLAPAACAPAALADGRVLCAVDPGGRGDFGLWLLAANGESRAMLLDLPDTWELDPALVPPTARPRTAKLAPRNTTPRHVAIGAPPASTFRYLARDVFAGRGAPARRDGAQLHVYRIASRESVERIGRIAVPRSGRVDVQLPADQPLFEVLTDAAGRALMSAHGPFQVRGFNSGARGSTSRCLGCHLGHSASR